MSAIAVSTTFVVDDRIPYPSYPSPLPLQHVNSLLRSGPGSGVTSSPVFTLFLSAALALTAVMKTLENLPPMLPQIPHLLSILLSVLSAFISTLQSLLLHPFFEIRRSVLNSPMIFWEYASVTFSFCTAWSTLHSLYPTRVVLERVMPTEQWALLMLMIGLIQFLVIPLGSPRARAVACVLALILWLPLVLIFVNRAGIRGPVPGFIVFAFGNYLHIFSLLRTPPCFPSQEPRDQWTHPPDPTKS